MVDGKTGDYFHIVCSLSRIAGGEYLFAFGGKDTKFQAYYVSFARLIIVKYKIYFFNSSFMVLISLIYRSYIVLISLIYHL